MKKKIHPKCEIVNVHTIQGKILKLKACLPADYHLSMDPSNHPAWTKSSRNVNATGKAAQFVEKYKGIEDL